MKIINSVYNRLIMKMNREILIIGQQSVETNLGKFEEMNRLGDEIIIIGEKARDFWRKGVQAESKENHHSIVTIADPILESDISHLIRKKFPGAKILGEEKGGEDLGKDYWVIDAIDGTFVFARGGRDWSLAIGHVKNGNFDFSMIYVPIGTEGPELYYAKRGLGAYVDEVWNGKKRTRMLGVTKTDNIKDAALAVRQDELWNYDRDVAKLARRCRGTNIPGSTSYVLANLAAGRFDIAVARAQPTWDLPGLLLVQEAGGQVTRMDGSGKFDFVTGGKDARNDFLATNGLLHENALRAFD